MMYMKCVRMLQFEEKPDYSLYRDFFKKLLLRTDTNDFLFDWCLLKVILF